MRPGSGDQRRAAIGSYSPVASLVSNGSRSRRTSGGRACVDEVDELASRCGRPDKQLTRLGVIRERRATASSARTVRRERGGSSAARAAAMLTMMRSRPRRQFRLCARDLVAQRTGRGHAHDHRASASAPSAPMSTACAGARTRCRAPLVAPPWPRSARSPPGIDGHGRGRISSALARSTPGGPSTRVTTRSQADARRVHRHRSGTIRSDTAASVPSWRSPSSRRQAARRDLAERSPPPT